MQQHSESSIETRINGTLLVWKSPKVNFGTGAECCGIETRHRKKIGTPSTARCKPLHARSIGTGKDDNETALAVKRWLEEHFNQASAYFLQKEHSVRMFEEELTPLLCSNQRRKNPRLSQHFHKRCRRDQLLPNPQRSNHHSTQTLRRRRWESSIILGSRRDMARKRMIKARRAQPLRVLHPGAAGVDSRTQERRVEYEPIHRFVGMAID